MIIKKTSDLNEILLDYINKNGIKQTFIADKIGKSKQMISYYLKSKALSIEEFITICNALGLEADINIELNLLEHYRG